MYLPFVVETGVNGHVAVYDVPAVIIIAPHRVLHCNCRGAGAGLRTAVGIYVRNIVRWVSQEISPVIPGG